MHTLPVLLGDERARRVTVALMLSFYVVVAALVVTGLLPVWALLVGLALPRFIKVLHVYSRPKPTGPPAGYPLWPLWFVSAAFVHARRAGALFVVGLLVGAISPLSF